MDDDRRPGMTEGSPREGSPEDREAAIDQIVTIGDRTAIPDLLAVAASNTDLIVRHAAVKAIGALGGASSVDNLIGLWALRRNSDDSAIHMSAAEALQEIGSDAVPALIGALQDPNWVVRWLAVQLLARLGDREALVAIRPLLNDDDETVRAAARAALAH